MPLQVFYADMPPFFPQSKALPPDGLPAVLGCGLRADGGFSAPEQPSGSAVMLHDRYSPQPEQLASLAQELSALAEKASLLIADFEQPVSRVWRELLHMLSGCGKLVVPEHYAPFMENYRAVLLRAYEPTLPFSRWLAERQRFGSLLPELCPICCSVAPGGRPEPLTREALELLRRGHTVYTSEALCCRYFSYLEHGTPVFVLFDEKETYEWRKERLEESGISQGIVLLQEYEHYFL